VLIVIEITSANHWLRARRQRRQDWSADQVAARARGEETHSEPESSGGDDEEDDKMERRGK
jgi:hypothetical protein